jgi:hypothetical protein
MLDFRENLQNFLLHDFNEDRVKEILGEDVQIYNKFHHYAKDVFHDTEQRTKDVKRMDFDFELLQATQENEIHVLSTPAVNMLQEYKYPMVERDMSGYSGMLMTTPTIVDKMHLPAIDAVGFMGCLTVMQDLIIQFELYKAGIFAYYKPENGPALALRIPDYHTMNGKLHSEKYPALEWEDEKQYWLRGVKFNFELWQGIVNETISPKEIFKIENAEQKTVAMSVYGYDNILRDMKVNVRDTMDLKIKGEDKQYQVIEADIGDEADGIPARFIKVVCHSTLKETILRVDPRAPETETVKGALAWTAGLSADEYQLEQET